MNLLRQLGKMSWWRRRTNCSVLTSLLQSRSSCTLFIRAYQKNCLRRHQALFCCSPCCSPLIAAMNSDALQDDRRRAEQSTPPTTVRQWSHWTKPVTCRLKTEGQGATFRGMLAMARHSEWAEVFECRRSWLLWWCVGACDCQCNTSDIRHQSNKDWSESHLIHFNPIQIDLSLKSMYCR